MYRVLGVKYLFNNAINNPNYAASNDLMMVNNYLKWTWKKQSWFTWNSIMEFV
jgi:hypothetical protein